MDPIVEELTSKLDNTVTRFVDFGSHILQWDTDMKRTEVYNTPIIMLYRHFLDLADSTSILIKQSAAEPCKIILRAMLETYFSMEYIFKEDTANRCMAFLVWNMHEKIKACEEADPTTERGKQLRARLSKDRFTRNIKLSDHPQAQIQKDALENQLKETEYQKAEQEYQNLRSKGEKNPPWYRLFDGPPSLFEMAERLELMSVYDKVYRNWSGPTHGTDIIQGKASRAADGTAEIIQLRHFGSLQEVTKWVLTLSLMMFELYINNRIPDKHHDYITWYSTIREPFLRISDKEPLITVL